MTKTDTSFAVDSTRVSSESCVLTNIIVSGTPTERGQQQGEALRETIDRTIRRWLDTIGSRQGTNPDTYLQELLESTNHVATIKAVTPQFLEEMQGIAQGANQSETRIVAYNLLDEEWAFSRGRTRTEPPGCTSGGFLRSDASPVLGQTMDIPSVHDGSQCAVIHERSNLPDLTVFTAAGIIALMGVNAAGVGVVVNNLATLPISSSGLPVSCVVRGILDHTSGKAAREFVTDVPHAIGQHYLIGDSTELVSLEADAERVRPVQIDGSICIHTNHPIAPQEVEDIDLTVFVGNSKERFQKMSDTLIDPSTVVELERALSDSEVPISRAPMSGFMTFGAMVAELTIPPVVTMAAGPPHQCGFETVVVAEGQDDSGSN